MEPNKQDDSFGNQVAAQIFGESLAPLLETPLGLALAAVVGLGALLWRWNKRPHSQ